MWGHLILNVKKVKTLLMTFKYVASQLKMKMQVLFSHKKLQNIMNIIINFFNYLMLLMQQKFFM